MRGTEPPRPRPFLVPVAILLTLVACQSFGGGGRPPNDVRTAATANEQALASLGASAPQNPSAARSTASITVTDANNGSTLALARGDIIAVVLGSTYWSFTGSSDATIVAPQADPQFQSMRNGCVMGGGCGFRFGRDSACMF